MSDPDYLQLERGQELLEHVLGKLESKLPRQHLPRWANLIAEDFEIDQALDVLKGELTDQGDLAAVADARRFWEAFQTL